MNSSYKGIIGTILGFISIFARALIKIFSVKHYLFATAMIPLVISIGAIYLGVKARREGSKVFGIAALFLGIIGVIGHIVKIISFM
jgi:hypothetical protein